MPFVCVQLILTSRSRWAEDLTFDKTDEKDAVLIAWLTAQPRCYVPEPVDEPWGRLRHLGTRREQLIVAMTGQVQQMRSLLECVWPAALDTVRQPFRSRTWLAALTDPTRFATARALVKHAGLAPREKSSGAFTGRTKLTGQGRPGLRLAAWRAVWGAQRANPVYAARYRHLHAVIATGRSWNSDIATHGATPTATATAA